MTATAPAPVAPGGTVTLSNINQTLAVPPAVFVAGYNLGLLTTGTNIIPVTISTGDRGHNTVQGSQNTNTVATTITTTITDPDGTPGTGDETATPGAVNVTYNDQTWTAGASGTIGFREYTTTPRDHHVAGGGIIIAAARRRLITSGSAAPRRRGRGRRGRARSSSPTAPTFASTQISVANTPPTANAGPDQTVASGATVNLNGTGSTDPDGTIASYAWTQTAGDA